MSIAHNPPSLTNRADTRPVSIPAPRATVFAFVANPENLPRWAVGFCKSIRRDPARPEQWIATTGQGDVALRYVTDEKLGVIDFHFSPAPGIELAAYSRVLPNADGAEYVFTQFQSAGMSDDVFRSQVHALVEELQVLRATIAAQLACPV